RDGRVAGTAARVRGEDGGRAATLKGDGRQAAVIAAAVAGTRRAPEEDVAVATAWGGVRVAGAGLGAPGWRRPPWPPWWTRSPPATCPTTSAGPPSDARPTAWCGPSWCGAAATRSSR